MICISKREREELEQVGLLQHKRTGFNACDANFTVVNREHIGRSKKTYVVEDEKILLYLGRYDGLNLQKVSERSSLEKSQKSKSRSGRNINPLEFVIRITKDIGA